MAYDIKSIIGMHAMAESCISNNIGEKIDGRQFDEVMRGLEESYVTLPVGPDAVHIFTHNDDYLVPMEDINKFCEAGGIETYEDAISILSEHYEIPRDKFVIVMTEADCAAIEYLSAKHGIEMNKVRIKTWDFGEFESVNSINLTRDRIISATKDGITCKLFDCPASHIEKSIKLALAEEYDLSKEVEDDTFEVIREEDPEYDDFDEDDEDILDAHEIIDAAYYKAEAVNVYRASDFEYYIEFSELERYMNVNHIESVSEAVKDVAYRNDLEPTAITLLIEANRLSKEEREKRKALKQKQREWNKKNYSFEREGRTGNPYKYGTKEHDQYAREEYNRRIIKVDPKYDASHPDHPQYKDGLRANEKLNPIIHPVNTLADKIADKIFGYNNYHKGELD